MSEKTVFTLSKPIKVGDEDLAQIELREPTGADLDDLGYPYLVMVGEGEGERIELRPKVAGRYISRLAGIPPSAVAKISLADRQRLQGVVMGFFGAAGETPAG